MISKNTKLPQVTIFIPVYNAAEFLHETVSSALNQTFTDFEVLAVDDGSTDNSIEILESFNDDKLRIEKNGVNRGRPYTRNRGIELARGEYLAVLDADDLAEPDRLAVQVDFLDQHPDIVAVGSFAHFIDGSGNIAFLCQVPTEFNQISRRIFNANCFIHSTVMFRRQILVDIGGYNSDFPQSQDYELFLRLCEHHKLANIDKPLVKYRFHPNQVSQTRLASQRRLAFHKARINAFYHRKMNGTLPEDVMELQILSFIDKLKAKSGSIGSDLLWWITLYRKLDQHNSANKLIKPLIMTAPFSLLTYKETYYYLSNIPFIGHFFYALNTLRKLVTKSLFNI